MRVFRGWCLALALVTGGAFVVAPHAHAAVTSTTRTVQYTGDGSTKAFSVTFLFHDKTHLVVKQKVAATGVESTKVLDTDYTVKGVGASAGGTVTFTTAPASGDTITISRVVPLTQPTSFRSQGSFSPKAHEDALDRTAMIAQQLQANINAIEAVSATGDADNFAIFDAAGSSSTNANGVKGIGKGTGDGLRGVGGATNGIGVVGQGTGTGIGVSGTGGSTSAIGVSGSGGSPNGTGVRGTGAGTGNGVLGTGGSTSGYGVEGRGGGTGAGVYGLGGDSNASGVKGTGGATNGIGVEGFGVGTGTGVKGTGASGNNARGVWGIGAGNEAGVRGEGGPTAGVGVAGIGGASDGAGGNFTGGASNGHGITATGDGTGEGVEATGGDSSAAGVKGIGGATNGDGVLGVGTGSGDGVEGTGGASGAGVRGTSGGTAPGVYGIGASNTDGVTGDTAGGTSTGSGVRGRQLGAGGASSAGVVGDGSAATSGAYGVIAQGDTTSPVRASLRVVPQDADPTSLQDGDVWLNTTAGQIRARVGGATKHMGTSGTTGAWSAQCNGTCAEGSNLLGPFRSTNHGGQFRRISCNWATAGTGGSTGVVVKVRNDTDATDLCSCTLGACTTGAGAVLSCACDGTFVTSKHYTLQLTTGTDCSANPADMVCNVEIVRE